HPTRPPPLHDALPISLRLGEAAPGKGDDPEAVRRHAGQALYALLLSQARRPAPWKTDLARKALPYYRQWWREHRDREAAAWQAADRKSTRLNSSHEWI